MAVHADKSLLILGCDVAKDTIVIYRSDTGELFTILNRKQSVRRFLTAFAGQHIFGICEATGGYESLLLEEFVRLGLAVHRADARKVKAYIRSLGIQGKTDALDAKALADYACERKDKLALWLPHGENQQQIQTLTLYRLDLVKLRSAERCRLKGPKSKAIASAIKRHLKHLDQQIKQIEEQISGLIAQDQCLDQTVHVMREMPGIGPIIANGLAALMPEIGTMTRRQVASLVGLAPYPCDSGKLKGRRRTKGGRREVRRLLFMAALVATRHNPMLKEFYERLKTSGKRPIVALTATMRKIIVILNAKVRDQIIKQES